MRLDICHSGPGKKDKTILGVSKKYLHEAPFLNEYIFYEMIPLKDVERF